MAKLQKLWRSCRSSYGEAAGAAMAKLQELWRSCRSSCRSTYKDGQQKNEHEQKCNDLAMMRDACMHACSELGSLVALRDACM
jgi:hypothetical protein